MKTTFRFIIAAMAAVSVFASCQKEMVGEISNNTNDAVRVISAQFDNSTKATLDGFKPSFENNDEIRVSNSEKSEVRKVTVSGSTASFTTTLSGELTAIYPADAAILSSNTDNAPIANSNNIKVLTSQTGSVKDAIIAKATVAVGENTATFYGQTAVFRITPGAAASTKYVEVITAGPEIANTTTTDYTKKNKIHVATDTDSEVFVSVLVPAGGLKLRDLSFADGINMKTVTDVTKGATAINSNTIYTITSSGWDRAYVEINGFKWATMNIGANSVTEAGTYFAWGDVVGCVPSGSTFSTSFDWAHAPFNNGQSTYDKTYFASVKDTEYPNGILALKNDAANVNWGGSWRMPTKAEFDALGSATKVTSPGNGRQFGTLPNTIFLPAAGMGTDTNLSYTEDGHYWLSSVGTDIFSSPNDQAYSLYFYQESALNTTYNRSYGMLVRALSE